jgi:C4-dicarboxylate-specific signal transduction histidine kinase
MPDTNARRCWLETRFGDDDDIYYEPATAAEKLTTIRTLADRLVRLVEIYQMKITVRGSEDEDTQTDTLHNIAGTLQLVTDALAHAADELDLK